MMLLTARRKIYIRKVIPILIIIFFSLLMIFPFLKINQLGVHSDWSFHSARVQQLYLNLKRGHLFTYIATDTFSKVGNGNFLFYPTIFLYPWVLLKFVFVPITAYLIYVWLLFLATGLIAFWCMQSFTKEKTWQSLFFSIIYLIAPYHLYLMLSNYVLGEAQAYTFIPLVLLGMYNVLYKKKWIMLGISMTFMAYTHYVSLFMSLEVCVVILLCYWIQSKRIRLNQFILLGKSIGLFILLSIWQFIPLFTDYIHRGLARPISGFMLMESAGNFFTSAITNDALNQGGIGLVLLTTLMFGWILIDKNSKYMWIYLLGILFTWMITTAFPWQYLVKTPLSIIQFPYRYTSYAIAFLAIVLSRILFTLHFKNISKNSLGCGIILIFLMLYAGSIYSDITRNSNTGKNIPVLTSSRRGKYQTFRDASDSPIIINNYSYNKQFSYGALYGETDYMPKRAFQNSNSILNRISYINGHKSTIRQTETANKLYYYIKIDRSSLINLPALRYANTKVYVNNELLNLRQSNRGTVMLKLPKGKYKVEVTYKPKVYLTILRIIALIIWIVLILRVIYRKLRYVSISESLNKMLHSYGTKP